jgi:hypothetical protein
MFSSNPAADNQYLYHWLSTERLERFFQREVLKPYWRHWVYERGGFARGISTSPDPVQWMPQEDEGVPAEPCIVIDRTAFNCDAVEMWSGETYHLTKDILRARKAGRDIGEILARVPSRRQTTYVVMDEIFVMTPIPIEAVAAIGYEPTRMYWGEVDVIMTIAERLDIPLINMDGWADNAPDVEDLDTLIHRAIASPNERVYY